MQIISILSSLESLQQAQFKPSYERQCPGDSSQNAGAMQLPEGAKGERFGSHLLSHGSLTVLRWGGRGGVQVLDFAVSLYRQRNHQAMSDPSCSGAALTPIPWYPILASRKSPVLRGVLEHSLLLSSSWHSKVKKSRRGSRKCCVWCSFSVNVGCWWNFQL